QYLLGAVYAALGNYKQAEKHYQAGMEILTQILTHVPEAFRDSYLEDPLKKAIFRELKDARQALAGVSAMVLHGDETLSGPPNPEDQYFLTLVQISRIINSLDSMDHLFQQILDLVLETVKAERGFLLVKDALTQELRLQMGRNVAKETLYEAETISHSI